jgi:hypothetical protein
MKKRDYIKMTRQNILERMKKYYQEHKQEISNQKKLYRKLHKNEVKEQKHQEYLRNKQKYLNRAKKYGKGYYESNKDKILRTHKKYYENHKEESRPHRTEYVRNRRKTDINFKIASNLKTRVWYALKGNPKLSTTMNLVGCSINQLKQHLEKKFIKGMSFSNYGKWHIDHIKPCASFDLSKSKEQRKCFHYTNLQPLWAKDNLSKGVN